MLTRHHLREASRLLADYHPEEPMAYPSADSPRAAATIDPRLHNERAQALRAVSMPLDDLQKQISDARERVIAKTSDINTLANQLFGPEAEGPNTGEKAHPPRSGRVGSLADEAEYLHHAIGELFRQVDRLAPLAG